MRFYLSSLLLFIMVLPVCCFSQTDQRIDLYNEYFQKKDFANALSMAESLIASFPDSMEFHREKAKMLAATNQQEEFFQQMKFIRNADSSDELTVFFSALSHDLVTRELRESLRRFYFARKDTAVLLRWPNIDKYDIVDCKNLVTETQDSSNAENFLFNSQQATQNVPKTHSTSQTPAVPVNFNPTLNNWPESSLTPLAPFQWSDNVPDIIQKLKTISTISEISYPGRGYLMSDLKVIELSHSDLVAAITETNKQFLDSLEIAEDEKIVLPNGKQSYYFTSGSSIKAQPIVLAGIPFEAHFNFAAVPGMLLINPTKAFRILGKSQEAYVVEALESIMLSPMDNSLANHNRAKLFKIISDKYPILKNTKGVSWDGQSQDYEWFHTQDGDCSYYFQPSFMQIVYKNSFESLNKKYTEYRSSILYQDGDLSSGL